MRTFLATFVGIIISFVVMMGAEILGHSIFPDLVEKAINEGVIANELLVTVLLAHILGLTIGLLIAKTIDKKTPYAIYLIASFILAGTVANLVTLNHPIWFMITDLILVVGIGGYFSVKSYQSINNN